MQFFGNPMQSPACHAKSCLSFGCHSGWLIIAKLSGFADFVLVYFGKRWLFPQLNSQTLMVGQNTIFTSNTRSRRDSLFVLYEDGLFLYIIAPRYLINLVGHAKEVGNDNHNCPNSWNMKQIEGFWCTLTTFFHFHSGTTSKAKKVYLALCRGSEKS